MMAKIFILFVMIIITVSLGSGLFFLIKDTGDSKRTVKALTVRIIVSLSLFLLLFIAFGLGWIRPHGLI